MTGPELEQLQGLSLLCGLKVEWEVENGLLRFTPTREIRGWTIRDFILGDATEYEKCVEVIQEFTTDPQLFFQRRAPVRRLRPT